MSAKQLHGKTAIITGGAGGIGRATALLFAHEGATVSIVDLNQAAGQEVAREISAAGGHAIFEHADVTRPADCRRVVERTLREFGGIHILFNNAGMIRRASVVEVIPIMARAEGGSIINTASGWGLAGGPRAAAYCASKGAVVLMTKAMAIDHGRQNIRVNCICPGDTDTAMLRSEARQLGEAEDRFLSDSARRPLGRVGTPGEIAHAALYLAGEAASFVTGVAVVVDGGGLAGSG
jgi:NAD(P)-dependent dehydrogenase (short-subunit alcohol dehydrogenase family)